MNDDLISRQAVIKLIRGCNSALEEPRIFESHHSGNIFEGYITELSSVTPQEPSRNMEEITEVIKSDADAETKCKMISNILTAKPHYFEEQEPKTGHWIWCVGSHKCSNCEEYTCFSDKELLKYCPNCGCRMVEPQESEET